MPYCPSLGEILEKDIGEVVGHTSGGATGAECLESGGVPARWRGRSRVIQGGRSERVNPMHAPRRAILMHAGEVVNFGQTQGGRDEPLQAASASSGWPRGDIIRL